MARKHAKKFSKKSAVEKTILVHATTERKIITNPETGLLEVVNVITPAVVKQGKAYESTTTKGQRNAVPERKGK
jgi:hypothetical protein